MNTQSMEQLLQEQAAAKKKLILGIVFSAIAFTQTYLVFFLAIYGRLMGAIFVLLLMAALACGGVGTPFLIIGIVKTITSNRKIALAKRENSSTPVNAQPIPPQAVPVARPAYVPPQPQMGPQTTYASRPQPAPVPQPQTIPQATPVPPTAPIAQASNPTEAVALDWKKYNPLDAGVSYQANKDYKFHRADGFVGSVPQKFADRTFPRCPMCCSNAPHWTIAQHNQMSWKGNLYLFKCADCGSVISMSMPDVTTLGNGASGVVSNPSVGLTNLMVKASSGKEAGAVYAVIESVGSSGVSCECEGKEFKLEHLQDMFLRK